MPTFVGIRPSRTQLAFSLGRARSDRTTKSPARPSAGRASGGDGHQRSSGSNQTRGPLPDVAAEDIETGSTPPTFQGVVLEVDELVCAEVERCLTAGSASGRERRSTARQSPVGVDTTSGGASRGPFRGSSVEAMGLEPNRLNRC